MQDVQYQNQVNQQYTNFIMILKRKNVNVYYYLLTQIVYALKLKKIFMKYCMGFLIFSI